MFKKIRKHYSQAVTRPLIYMICTRFPISLLVILLIDRFVKSQTNLRMYGAFFFCVLFVLLAWIAWLRLDGIKLPNLMMKRVAMKKRPVRTYGDMIDYVDEPIPSFDDLGTEEKDVCCLLADAVCAVILLILSFIWM